MKQILKQSRGFQVNEASDVIDHVLLEKLINIYLFYTYIYKINTVNIQLYTNLECNILCSKKSLIFFYKNKTLTFTLLVPYG